MKPYRLYASIVLIGSNFFFLALSGFPMLTFVQEHERAQHAGVIYEQFVREAGYARLAIGAIGILILLFPFRKGARWSWFALAILLLVYWLPAFTIPMFMPFMGWHIFWEGLVRPGESTIFFNLHLPTLGVIGLLLSLPHFVQKPTKGPTQSAKAF